MLQSQLTGLVRPKFVNYRPVMLRTAPTEAAFTEAELQELDLTYHTQLRPRAYDEDRRRVCST
jgi:hypothetical protein